MDLIDNIKRILTQGNELVSPLFDLHYDNQFNVIGYVADEYFENKEDKDSQRFIWDNLKTFLAQEDLIRIISIFHESPKERVERLITNTTNNNSKSNFWKHETPDSKKYWLFVGVEKFDEIYKSFYLILNPQENFRKGLILVYDKDIISFMDLDQTEIIDELYDNIFKNAEAEIKAQLIHKYEQLTEKGLWGNSNHYYYVFDSFQLKPMDKSRIIFDNHEIEVVEEAIKQLNEFSFTNTLKTILNWSKKFNAMKSELYS